MADDWVDDMAILAALFVIGVPITLALVLIDKGIEWNDRQTLIKEAQAVFGRVRAETSPDLQIDPLLQAIFGEDMHFTEAGATQTDDWWTQIIFGNE